MAVVGAPSLNERQLTSCPTPPRIASSLLDVTDSDLLSTLLADDALAGITTRPIGDLRSFRYQAGQVEGDVSMVRRIAQGRLDIIGHEVQRRQGSTDIAALDDLLYDLPDILADPSEAGAARSGRAVEINDPGVTAADLGARLDAVISPGELSGVGDLSDERLNESFSNVSAIEQELSDIRRRLHDRIDAVQQEIGRRYRDGEASIESFGR